MPGREVVDAPVHHAPGPICMKLELISDNAWCTDVRHNMKRLGTSSKCRRADEDLRTATLKATLSTQSSPMEKHLRHADIDGPTAKRWVNSRAQRWSACQASAWQGRWHLLGELGRLEAQHSGRGNALLWLFAFLDTHIVLVASASWPVTGHIVHWGLGRVAKKYLDRRSAIAFWRALKGAMLHTLSVLHSRAS